MNNAFTLPDNNWMTPINDFARETPWLHTIAYDFATYGVVLFGALLIAGWWIARRDSDPARMAAALWAGAGTLIAVGINQPLVAAFHEARPYTSIPGLLVLAHRSTDPSFPSDHATMAGAAAAGLLLFAPKLGKIAAGTALVMAAARVYIAAHYPHDVVAGLTLGAVVAVVGWYLVRKPLTRLVERLSETPVRPLLTAAPTPTELRLINAA
ncbi:phosphatase PAP2 family protein [Smaragdicoccus niigatensis]|uniref:phosphatase PAP2 family protein n=1 Tax=Smaragdicoccus niigatensis TaxID=359359 RepID=UPI0003735875|nr:phosphatase PAP2 family protein [Smaragdicoccus niigatensis]